MSEEQEEYVVTEEPEVDDTGRDDGNGDGDDGDDGSPEDDFEQSVIYSQFTEGFVNHSDHFKPGVKLIDLDSGILGEKEDRINAWLNDEDENGILLSLISIQQIVPVGNKLAIFYYERLLEDEED